MDFPNIFGNKYNNKQKLINKEKKRKESRYLSKKQWDELMEVPIKIREDCQERYNEMEERLNNRIKLLEKALKITENELQKESRDRINTEKDKNSVVNDNKKILTGTKKIMEQLDLCNKNKKTRKKTYHI